MTLAPPPSRFTSLPRARALGVAVPVATGFRARLLGLALLPRERAGPGLLLPRCRSVHSFGMRFPIDVVFLDSSGGELRRERLQPRRLARERLAAAVLELPAADAVPGGPVTPEGGVERGGGI